MIPSKQSVLVACVVPVVRWFRFVRSLGYGLPLSEVVATNQSRFPLEKLLFDSMQRRHFDHTSRNFNFFDALWCFDTPYIGEHV